MRMKPAPNTPCPPAAALAALLDWMDRQRLSQLVTRTQLLITPGYDMKIAGALVTNFHQPESTLLLLVAALIVEDWKKVYRYALDHAFRFLSFGDGSLLFPLRKSRYPISQKIKTASGCTKRLQLL